MQTQCYCLKRLAFFADEVVWSRQLLEPGCAELNAPARIVIGQSDESGAGAEATAKTPAFPANTCWSD
jgi:hypothetical protein